MWELLKTFMLGVILIANIAEWGILFDVNVRQKKLVLYFYNQLDRIDYEEDQIMRTLNKQAIPLASPARPEPNLMPTPWAPQ